jgi:prophage regulatory protein
MPNISVPQRPVGLPATGYLRQAQIIPGLIPVSSSTWWRWVRTGKAPKSVKLSENVTAWRCEEIRDFIDRQVTVG